MVASILLGVVALLTVTLLVWAAVKVVRVNVAEQRRRRSLTEDQRAAERRRKAAVRRWGSQDGPGGSGGWMNGA